MKTRRSSSVGATADSDLAGEALLWGIDTHNRSAHPRSRAATGIPRAGCRRVGGQGDGGERENRGDERAFDALSTNDGVKVIRTPVQAPNANAHTERCVGSIRRACLDRTLIFARRQLEHVLRV
jgi:hypothetical protein